MSDGVFAAAQLFSGLSLAAILLLAALGLTLSFGLMRVINMAHGELLMLGGYLAYLAQQTIPGDGSFFLALPLAFVGASAFGVALYATVIRRLEGRPLDTLLATWGASLILQQLARSVFGATGVEVTAPAWLQGSVAVGGGVSLSVLRLFILALAAATLGGLWTLFQKTELGLRVRAVSQDRETAAAMGVNSGRINAIVFALGSGLAGLAGACLAFLAPVTPTVGSSYIVDAFLVVIAGGVGNIFGAGLAALLLGLFSAGTQTFASASVAKTLLLAATIVLLQFRPQGLLPERTREAV